MTTPEFFPRLDRAGELRQAFDAAFALPPPPPPAPAAVLLLVRAGGELLAVNRAELTGFVREENLARVPGRSPAFLGLAAVRGELFPVWSLAGLLGRPQIPGAGWLLLTATSGGAPCAFACEAFEKIAFVPEAALGAASLPGTPALVPCDGALVPVACLSAFHAVIFNCQKPEQPRRLSP